MAVVEKEKAANRKSLQALEDEVFRQSDESYFAINATDIIELLTYKELECGIVTLFEILGHCIILRDTPHRTRIKGRKETRDWVLGFKKAGKGVIKGFGVTGCGFGEIDVKTASTPTDLEKPLVKDGDAAEVDEHLYRSMIGSLMYLTASRPDIIYLKGKPTLGLWYPKDSLLELVAYTNSDYAGATQDRKSTTGGCQFLSNRLISWQCKKQTVVATSTTESEYVAAASCCEQHNMVAFLEKSTGSEGFHQVIDFLNRSHISYALTKKPDVYISYIKQFWRSAEATSDDNGDVTITATIDGHSISLTEASLRRHLKLDDHDGDDVIIISSDKVEGSGDWNSPEYQDTTLCLDYEVKKGKKLVKKELIVALKGELYFVKFIINPEEDDFAPGVILGRSFTRDIAQGKQEDREGRSSDDWDQLLDFNFDDVPKSGEELPPFVCKMGKSNRNKKRAMENLNLFLSLIINLKLLKHITIADLEGVGLEMLKRQYKNDVELEYHVEKLKATVLEEAQSNNVNLSTGEKYTTSLTKHFATRYHTEGIEDLIPDRWSKKIHLYQIDALNEIHHLEDARKDFFKAEMGNRSSNMVYSDKRIIFVVEVNVKVNVKKKWGYSFLMSIVVRRSDNKEYEFSYTDLPRLSLNDVEDMYLLKVQDKLHHLKLDIEIDFINALLLFIKRVVIQNRIEDLQLRVEIYQRTLNLTKPKFYFLGIDQKIPYTTLGTEKEVVYVNQHNMKSLMKLNEVNKFCDGTLLKVQEDLLKMVKKNVLGHGNKRLDVRGIEKKRHQEIKRDARKD
ncbi:hypothetical protein Tco_0672510 [Tanacetum coccineum]